VEKAKVFKRVNTEQVGPEDVASEAVVSAVHELFKDGLPEELMGPASMSRLGFRAALLGFAQTLQDGSKDPKPQRRRLVLDLVNTELDYDVQPKMDELDLAVRRQAAQLEIEALAAKKESAFKRMLDARAQWFLIRKDLERVKEIRTRARERGVVPSPRPLRFEDPEPQEWPDAKAVAAYKKDLREAHKTAAQALAAYLKNDLGAYLKYWAKDQEHTAKRAFEDGHNDDKRYGYKYVIVKDFAVTPWLLERAVTAHKEGKVNVYVVSYRDGKPYDDEQITLLKQDGTWRVVYW
jgi:hypothetical protein